MYRLVRGNFDPGLDLDKSFLRKTAELVGRHSHGGATREPRATYALSGNSLEAIATQDQSDIVKVFNLIEVRAWAERIGVGPHEIHLKPMKRKWASCSTRGRLTFDSGLLGQAEQFRREVVVHELVHLKELNHGKLFRARLRAYLTPSDLIGSNDRSE